MLTNCTIFAEASKQSTYTKYSPQRRRLQRTKNLYKKKQVLMGDYYTTYVGNEYKPIIPPKIGRR
jgi:hypothetical protein